MTSLIRRYTSAIASRVSHSQLPSYPPSVQVTSQLLCNVIGDQIASYIHDQGCIRLIQCFLNPQLMLFHPHQDTEQSDYHMFKSRAKIVDPLHQLFLSSEYQMGKNISFAAGC